MPCVVTDVCHHCKTRACLSVCPIDCFFETDGQMVFIDPVECFECLCCYLACPVEAIWPEKSLPDDKKDWAGINRIKTRSGQATRCAAIPLLLPEGARSVWPGRCAAMAYPEKRPEQPAQPETRIEPAPRAERVQADVGAGEKTPEPRGDGHEAILTLGGFAYSG